MTDVLDNIEEVKKLDSKNMLGSIGSLGMQVEEVYPEALKLKLPAGYKNFKNIVVFGMGGSALGADIMRSLFFNELKIPVQIVNNYRVPAYVDKNTLVLGIAYSGTTEEPLNAVEEARRRKAKIIVITTGNKLGEWAKKFKVPALVFSTRNNPCGSPRMGIGYTLFGQLVILSKLGLIKLSSNDIKKLILTAKKFNKIFGVLSDVNEAKEIARRTYGRSAWFVSAEHLSGNAHVAANQMNENAKRFAGYFIVPELNHHLMEGMMHPKDNKNKLLFVLFESSAYDKKVKKRIEITKDIFRKNNIQFISYACKEKSKIGQVVETLVLSGYASFYSAILEGLDPTAIPYVDYFKEQLKK